MSLYHNGSPTALESGAPRGVLTVGLVGVGGFGAYHLKFLRTAQEQGLCRLVAVADPSGSRLAEVRQSLEEQGVQWFDDYLEMVAAVKLDLVIIATPIPLHAEMTLQLLVLTDAAIYLEKPPAPTLGQLQQLIDADPTCRVHVGFQMVMWSAFRQLKTWICEGRLGEIQQITAGAVWPRGNGYYERANWVGQLVTGNGVPVFDGPATNALAHLVHSIMYLAADGMEGYVQPEQVRGEFYRARPIPSYDAACLAGRFASGIEYALAVAHCSRNEQEFTVRVQGNRGVAQVSANGRRLECDFAPPQEFPDPYDATMHCETLARIREGRPPVNSLRDCLGYSLATCGGLVASGNIHDIAPEYIEPGATHPAGVYHVLGMDEAVAATIKTGLTWSEQRVPWAQILHSTHQPFANQAPMDLGMFQPAGLLRPALV